MSRRFSRFSLAIVGLALVVGAASCAPAAAQTRAVPDSRAELQLSFAPLVKRTAPAVVNIYARRVVRTAPSALFNDPFFRRFFGEAVPERREQIAQSLGSGVIVEPQGLIVTNNHVIRNAEEVTVVLADRREFEASVLLADERTDLAVLRIDAAGEKLPHLALANSDDLEVGDLVLAIGNPFGVGQTVTSGIVSALARTTVGISDFRFFIQTDAAINPGNSGGALVSTDGRLVGVNTAIFSRDGGSNGIGFAIPANMVRTVVAGVQSGRPLVRPWLGASGQSVTADIAASLGLARPLGVLVNDVHPAGPAERAGIRRGDVVTAVDGREVSDSEALRYRVATHAVGAGLRMTLWRGGREQTVNVTLVAPPETPPRDVSLLRGNHPLAGATVANMSPALADQVGLPDSARGVVVMGVEGGSPARSLRLAGGDILVRINDRDIRSVEELKRLVAQLGRPWRMVVRRGDRLLNVVVGG